LTVRRICILLYDRAAAVGQCGDAVLLVAMIEKNVVAAIDASNYFVDVAGEYILVSGTGGGGSCCVISECLLAVLEVDYVRGSVVSTDSAAEGIPLVEDVVAADIVGVGCSQFIVEIPLDLEWIAAGTKYRRDQCGVAFGVVQHVLGGGSENLIGGAVRANLLAGVLGKTVPIAHR